MRELGAARTFPDRPDVRRSRLQPLIDANITAGVHLNAGLLESNVRCIRDASGSDEEVAALDLLRVGGGAHSDGDILTGAAVHFNGRSPQQDLNAFLAQHTPHLIGNVGVLPIHQLRPSFDDRHAAAEAAISLGHFDADIATAEHNQMCRHDAEVQGLDMGERPGSLEAGNIRDCRVGSDIDEDLIAHQRAGATLIQQHLDGFRRHEPPFSHDQFGTARLVCLQVEGNLAVDHLALALAHPCHVGCHGTRHRAELRGVMRQMRDPCAPNLVLARQASDGGTRAADPAALHDGDTFPRSRKVPSQQLAPLSATKDQNFEPLCLRHELPP